MLVRFQALSADIGPKFLARPSPAFGRVPGEPPIGLPKNGPGLNRQKIPSGSVLQGAEHEHEHRHGESVSSELVRPEISKERRAQVSDDDDTLVFRLALSLHVTGGLHHKDALQKRGGGAGQEACTGLLKNPT